MKLMWTLLIGSSLLSVAGPVHGQSLKKDLLEEDPASLAAVARERGSAVRGVILFNQQRIACGRCHVPGSNDMAGPDLTRLDENATDKHLVESILEPSKVIARGFESVTLLTTGGKIHSGRLVERNADRIVIRDLQSDRLITLLPNEVDEIATNEKSGMPDDVTDQLTDRQQFLDLVKYVMQLVEGGPGATGNRAEFPGGQPPSEVVRGLALLDELQCTACHQRDPQAGHLIPPRQAPDLAWAGGRIDPHYIARFVADPAHVKPGTTMPQTLVGLDDDARREMAMAMTHYIVSLSARTFATQSVDAEAAARGRESFHTVGCVACHSPRDVDGRERFAETSVPLGSPAEKYNVEGLLDLLEDPHVVRPAGRMPNMRLTHWEALDITHYLLNEEGGSPPEPFVLDRALAAEGREHFKRVGCAECHVLEPSRGRRDYPPLAEVDPDRGCLSSVAGDWPVYTLSDVQRTAIRTALSRDSGELTDQEQISLTLTAFRCSACHQRDNLGGVTAERDEYFQTTNQNLGPQGRLPPTLTGVGAKLRPQWLRDVLVSGRTIRPYMKTRMPQYGVDNIVHVVDLLQRVDQLPEVDPIRVADERETRNLGLELAGNQGLNCVACHMYQQKPGETMPAVDLTEMAERLERDWFHHYLRDPQRFSQNTVMPSFWPGGRAVRTDILDGRTEQQIEALWYYLQDGRQARAPRGLTREPIELLAGDEAVMLRRSYEGIGKRGIGVGYPGQVNLAFDAEQMRLAMIWKGKFAEASGVWRGQGAGRVRPLGDDLIRFTGGPELNDAGAPALAEGERPPDHRFKGYYLDDLMRPTFVYRFANVDVEDYPIDVADSDSGAVRFRRTITLSSEQGREDMVFRVAADENITSDGDATFLIGDALHVRVVSPQPARIVDSSDGQQLVIPLDLPAGTTTFIIEYLW